MQEELPINPAKQTAATLTGGNVVATPQVEITNIVYKAKVKRTQSDEYVEISNQETTPADVSGWQIVSGVGRNKAFTFPQGTILAPGQSVRVYTNEVHPESGGFSYGSGVSLWKDSGDEARLLDAQGNLVSGLAYDSKGNFTKTTTANQKTSAVDSLAENMMPQSTDANINELVNKTVFIENQETKRYLFSDGAPIQGQRGDKGGWLASGGLESPKVVGADANYYNRALWKIIPSGDNFVIENQETKRYLFSDGAPIKGERGDEGGWLASSGFESPNIIGADADYYNRALWKIIPSGDSFIIENKETKRYLFSDGAPIKGERGDEGGWLASSGFESPKVVGADANYYNRALWKITTI
ncbi:lamin tail domain-containing protein [Nodularia spumigena]|uniref:lamin tail domain-containing protein n=1 Tax=Nodularia spumigena TaxID=70799 RepID=UPI002330E136|nr:lamin tail domain-containing protein [Nodularia spumigena]MDB9319299.1 lamin tail domain-containing protein [Nodularia spumigena CS-590/01A]MDB9324321.1 lamin tail domain-containing protein [Nodularia spumigena CS-591/07A]MDB9332589.1 lamin tail domain-containing protein [Nodularia spumigena CS-591/04]MDB9337232.1 lamin tail domain-containing protein [Nodularia spumigena CS-590/01]